MNTNTIIDAVVATFVAQIVEQIKPLIAEQVQQALSTQVNSVAAGAAALDPGLFRDAIVKLVRTDSDVRSEIRESLGDFIEDAVTSKISDSVDLTEYREFRSLMSDVESLRSDVDDLESRDAFDADNDNFAEAVCEVIRSKLG